MLLHTQYLTATHCRALYRLYNSLLLHSAAALSHIKSYIHQPVYTGCCLSSSRCLCSLSLLKTRIKTITLSLTSTIPSKESQLLFGSSHNATPTKLNDNGIAQQSI